MKSGWSEAALGEVATIVRRSVKPTDIVDGTLYVGLENIERGGAISDVSRVSSGELASAKFAFAASDILYGKLRPNLGKIARPTFAGVCSTDILPIAPGSAIDRDYLAHFLARPEIVQLAADRATGANLPRISPTELERFRVVFPPLAEQRRIARALDATDRLRQARNEFTARLPTVIEGLFANTVSSATSRHALQSLCSVAGEYGAAVSSIPFDGTRPRYVRITDIQSDGYLNDDRVAPAGAPRLWQNKTLSVGDMVFARSGATVGKAYLHRAYSEPSVFAGYLLRFRVDPLRLRPEYLFAYTMTAEYRAWVVSQQRAVAQPNINAKQYGELLVPVPSPMVQDAFVASFRAVERQHVLAQRHLAQLDALFASLQDRAFKGVL